MEKVAILIFQIIVFIIVFMCVIFIAYISTKFIGKKTLKTMKSKNMQIVDSISIGMDKILYLIKAGNKCFVISVCGKSVTFLTNVDLEGIEINNNEEETSNSTNKFLKYLDESISKIKNKNISEEENTDNVNFDLNNNITRLRNSIKKITDRNNDRKDNSNG
jgi:flagellar protein FliO/FliZ